MPSFKFVPAADVSLVTFTGLLNRTYSDYYVPLDMTASHMRRRIVRDDIDMQSSVVVMDDDYPIALGMIARRGAHAWIGGVGVLPNYRGQGIGRQIMHILLDAAHQHHVDRVQLEVIQQNTPAIRLYDSLGFQRQRALHVAEGLIKPPAGQHTTQHIPPDELLQYYDRFHTVPNPWQRQKTTLLRMLQLLTGVAALSDKGDVIAYALGVFGGDIVRFVDLASLPGRNDALRSLVSTLHHRHPAAIGSIINITADDPAWAVLSGLGYHTTLSQHEMTLTL